MKYSSGISVRDNISQENVQSILPSKKIFKIPDSALVFDLENIVNIKEIENLNVSSITLVFRDFFEPYIKEIGYIIKDLMKELDIEQVNIIVFENNPTERHIASSMKDFLKGFSKKVEIIDNIDPIQYLLTLNTSDLVISGRLHGILPSSILQKKLICMSYAPKIESFCSEHQYPYLDFTDLLNIKEVNIYDYIIPFSETNRHPVNKEALNKFLDYIEQTQQIDILQVNNFVKIKLFTKLLLFGLYLLSAHVLNKIKKTKIHSE